MDYGLHAGIEDAETVALVEWNPYAQRVLRKRFPGVPILKDVEEVADLAEAGRLGEVIPGWPFDDWEREGLIVGGFPCQNLSRIGCREGLSGDRSRYYHHMARVVYETLPPWVLIENSPDLLKLGFGSIVEDFSMMGYNVAWDVVPAEAVGAPHKRSRVFIVAHHPAYPFRFRPPEVSEWWTQRRVPGLHTISPIHFPGFDVEPAGEKGRPLHYTEQIERVGNAVVPQVAAHIGELIDEAVSEAEWSPTGLFPVGHAARVFEPRQKWLREGLVSDKPLAIYGGDRDWKAGSPSAALWYPPGPSRPTEGWYPVGEAAIYQVLYYSCGEKDPNTGRKRGCPKPYSCVEDDVDPPRSCALTKWPNSGLVVTVEDGDGYLQAQAFEMRGVTPPSGPKTLYIGALVWIRRPPGESGSFGGVGDMYPGIVVGYDGETSLTEPDPDPGKTTVERWAPTGFSGLYSAPSLRSSAPRRFRKGPSGQEVWVETEGGFVHTLKRSDLHRFPTPAKTEHKGGMGEGWETPARDTMYKRRARGGQIRHWGLGQTPVNPRFVEFLMGLPEGWVDVSQREAFKGLGQDPDALSPSLRAALGIEDE